MASSFYEVEVRPNATGFAEQLRKQLAEVLTGVDLGVVAEEIETFEYDACGRVIKRIRTVQVKGVES